MILVVDDCPRRIEAFMRALGHTEQARTFAAAARSLRTMTGLTAIYLDFDGVDGEHLARLMADERLHTDARVMIHSSNYAGAIKMRDALKDTHDVELVDWREVTGCGEAG